MIEYIIQSSLVWIGAFALYWFLLRKQTFFVLNRYFLLFSLILGFLLPIIGDHMNSLESDVLYEYRASVVQVTEVTANHTTHLNLWLWVYLIVTSVMLLRLFYGLYSIAKLYSAGEKILWEKYCIVKTSNRIQPFSFFHYVFMNDMSDEEEIKDMILTHESIHVDQYHTFDVLFVSLVQVFFWFNPVLILYKRELKSIHEYIADHIVVKKYNKVKYSQLLVEHVLSGKQFALTNQFFSSNIKNRIKMMYKKNSSPYQKWAYALCIPVFSLLLMSFAPVKKTYLPIDKLHVLSNNIIGDTLPPTPPTPPAQPKMVLPEAPPAPPQDVTYFVDEAPRFPGCEEITDESERSSCSRQELLEFIYSSIKYPEEARAAKKEGTVVTRFVIQKDGSIGDVRVARGIYPSLDEETIRVIKTMPRWIPGKRRGEVVHVYYTLPVRFELANDKK